MGLYVNPDNQAFTETVNSDIYVDKSELLLFVDSRFAKEDRNLCVSRPRRFGKSVTTNMIAAFYSCGCNSRHLFSRFKVAQTEGWDQHLNSCNVIRVDIQAFWNRVSDKMHLVDKITSALIYEMRQEFPNVQIDNDLSLSEAMMRVYGQTHKPFVVLFDEYDVVVRNRTTNDVLQNYITFLADLFKSLEMRDVIKLSYLTGILPIVRDKMQSKLNNFSEFTMESAKQLAQFVGFTRSEVETLCTEHNMDIEQCLKWYDGYRLNNNVDVSAPYSVVQAMTSHSFEGHWTRTGSFESLRDYISMDMDGIRADVACLMAGQSIEVNVGTYLNTLTDFNSKDDIFTYLIHLGYLAYNHDDKLAYIPNHEVMQEWRNSVDNNPKYRVVAQFMDNSWALLQATLSANEEAVARALDQAHQEATSPLTYNNEASLQSAIGMAYFCTSADYRIIKEFPSGRGFADMAFIPKHSGLPAIIVELKWDKSAAMALKQAATKRYADALRGANTDVLLVGVNYSQETKQHTCKILRIPSSDICSC
ncbi:MAG: AAA family ATPase [Bacteroidales bacterium]|nr:AAA family ATPase [Bacteroidales bacterium]